MLTLVALALLVFFAATGVAGWRAIVFDPASGEPSDAPLPLALAHVVGQDSMLFSLLIHVGLLGLIASFHGILLAAARATFEFGRSGYLPSIVGRVHLGTGTPRVALLVNLLLGIVAILTGRTGEIITLACFGALSLYVLSMAALVRLRTTEPDLERPFRAVGYPTLAYAAGGIAALCLLAMIWTQPVIAGVYAALVGLGLTYYAVFVRRR
jgi:ethanolamine permease